MTIREPGGGATQITYDKEDLVRSSRTLDKDKRVLETYQKHKDGSASYKLFNHKTGVTTEGEIWENGSQVIKQVDKDGTLLNEVGLTKKGSLFFSYTIGGDEENGWKAGITFSKGRAESKQSFIADTHSLSESYENPRQAEIDQKLIVQMNGGKAVAGEDLIVRNTWKTDVEFESHEAMNKSLRDRDYEHITSDTEIRAIDPNGPYDVRHVGLNPVKGSGEGKSQSEALSNALQEAAHVVRTDIQSEWISHTKSHEASKGGKTTAWTMDERVAEQSEHRANVILKDYKVTAVKKTEFGYEVIIDATPGVTVRK